MTALQKIREGLKGIGYRHDAVVADYSYADALSAGGPLRRVATAAFTQSPPSYRSAAIGVIDGDVDDATLETHAGLGAPLLLVVGSDRVSVWQVLAKGKPRKIEDIDPADISGLFERNSENWKPDTIHRAKSIGSIDLTYQRDFVDAGLMAAVESEIHVKLDHLLTEAMQAAASVSKEIEDDPRQAFRVVFRLLAAKVLIDRGNPAASGWSDADLGDVLAGIEGYYSLPSVLDAYSRSRSEPYRRAWTVLRNGINFANISSEDLAFVYENTFVTPATRKALGTHSTPRQLAEYAVMRLELHKHEPDDLHVYEPFAGAGIFLVSALRHLRELLPSDWSDARRHEFLVDHVSGDELDPFAAEVATLSLILADYPNKNGWHIRERDLFEEGVLAARLAGKNVVLCNPPFQAFGPEGSHYPAAKLTKFKPVALLDAVLDAAPELMAIVLPRPFVQNKRYAKQRARIERMYSEVEVVRLPDKIFGSTAIESSLLIAKGLRTKDDTRISVTATDVTDAGRKAFLRTGAVSSQVTANRHVGDDADGTLWIPSLHRAWSALSYLPRLGDLVEIHRGIEWNYEQEDAWSLEPQKGYVRGTHTSVGQQQFAAPRPVWLDGRPEKLRGNAIKFPWASPKLLVNAGRLGRGGWRLAASVDLTGLVGSQQWFGLWPKVDMSEAELVSLAAVLNGPVANAFIADNSPDKGIRVSEMNQIPVPAKLPDVAKLVAEFIKLEQEDMQSPDRRESLTALLDRIDAGVLGAYGMAHRWENQVLSIFIDGKRPILGQEWEHWNKRYTHKGLTLAERVSGKKAIDRNWVLEVFQPVPKEEAEAFRRNGYR